MKKNILIIALAAVIILCMVLSITNVINDTLGMSIAFILFIIFSLLIAKVARKNDIKIIEYLMILFAVVSAILLIFSIRAYFKLNGNSVYKFQVTVSESTSPKTHRFTYNGNDYYTYNLENVNVIMRDNNETISLQTALETQKVSLDEILNLAVPNTNTVGYKIYYDGGQPKYKNDEYSIVVCENEKKDVVFTTFNYTYDSSICK